MYGWAGKILRVNFTNGEIRTQSTEDYREYIGGMGIGCKILYDEVPVGTEPYSPEAKVVFGVGPMTASGVPSAGRTNITALSSWTKGFSVLDGHMGGHFGHAMKYAGYDAIVLEGKAASPVYLKIDNDTVTIEDASDLWGKGTKETMAELSRKDGNEFSVACIGPAGENLVNMSCVICSAGNVAGGGTGSALGAKNVKAISCRGTGSVKVADPKKLKELCDYQLKDIIGAYNNHPLPTNPQSWSELTAVVGNGWQGAPGHVMGMAEGGPIDSGEQPAHDVNKIGWRAMKAFDDWGEMANNYLEKIVGCASCPIRCYYTLNNPHMAELGLKTKATNVCGGYKFPSRFYANGTHDFFEEGDSALVLSMHGANVVDDYGLWTGYGDIGYDFKYCWKHGIFEKVIPADEYAEIPWQLMLDGDPKWIDEMTRRISLKIGEFSHLGDGSYLLAQRWNLGDEYWNDPANKKVSRVGFTQHHGPDQVGQAGLLYNTVYNRDCMAHASSNYTRSGLPHDILIRNGEKIWGEGFMDKTKHYTPINPSKIRFAKFCLWTKQWHDSATLCNWVWPMSLSSSPERDYEGDLTLEAQYMTAITGEDWTPEKVDWYSEKITNMMRVMTILSYGTANMREEHDKINDWFFDADQEHQPFEEGTTRMDRADWEKSLDMWYDELGWDRATGAPTRATLERLDLKYMADALEAKGLLVG